MNKQLKILGHLKLISHCADTLQKEENWKEWKHINANKTYLVWNSNRLAKPTSLAKNIKVAAEQLEALLIVKNN